MRNNRTIGNRPDDRLCRENSASDLEDASFVIPEKLDQCVGLYPSRAGLNPCPVFPALPPCRGVRLPNVAFRLVQKRAAHYQVARSPNVESDRGGLIGRVFDVL